MNNSDCYKYENNKPKPTFEVSNTVANSQLYSLVSTKYAFMVQFLQLFGYMGISMDCVVNLLN